MTTSTITEYPVMEHFATIQGEGFYAGTPAYFIRLGGCDVGCHWCDVKDSWPIDTHPKIESKDLVDAVLESGLNIVVITGGEPAMHDLTALISSLRSAGLKCHIETSGAHTLTGNFDWITFSPKKFKAPLDSVISLANELKVIVFNRSDFQFADEYKSKMEVGAQLFLQPEWEKRDEMTPSIIEYIKEHPEWRITLQTHKYMKIP